jgi:CRP/FNR family transcriptional regulator
VSAALVLPLGLVAVGLGARTVPTRAKSGRYRRVVEDRAGQGSAVEVAIDALRRTQLFAGMPTPVLAPLAHRARPATHSRGELVRGHAGGRADIFVVTEGRARVSRVSPQGRTLAYRELREGDIYGLPFLGVDPPVGNQVEVTSPILRTYHFPAGAVEETVAANSELSHRALRLVGQSFTQVCDQTESLAFESMRVRLARTLATVAYDDGGRLLVCQTRDDLAARIGSRPEEVSRELGKLAQEGLVRVVPYRQTIKVLDRDALAAHE